MEIFVENNAFHHVSECLEKKCTFRDLLGNNDKHQIEDLLQFCIQVVFYDKIYIAGNVPEKNWDTSIQLKDDLKTHWKINNVHTERIIDAKNGVDGETRAHDLIINASEAIKANIPNVVKDCFDSDKNNPCKLEFFFPSLTDERVQTAILHVTQGIARGDEKVVRGYFGTHRSAHSDDIKI